MYSRKTIRPTLTSANTISDRPTTAPSTSPSPLPPPDYAGIAFRVPADRTGQDFPETVITPPLEDSTPEAEEVPETVYSAPEGEDESFFFEEEPSEAVSGADRDPIEQAPMPEETPSEQLPPAEDIVDSDRTSALEWLRALKMEDLLLFWLLFMLLYGEEREEIDLLLCLLLFAGH